MRAYLACKNKGLNLEQDIREELSSKTKMYVRAVSASEAMTANYRKCPYTI